MPHEFEVPPPNPPRPVKAPGRPHEWARAVRHVLLVFAMLAVSVGAVAAPAHADDPAEMGEDCQYNAPYLGSAGYSVSSYTVWVTSGWQYVGDWTSFCEDINIAPYQALWNSGIVKARTYMCNSAGSCWYNAWRNCQGGCEAATDMVDGTRYQVHVYMNQHPGWYAQLWD